MLGFALPPYTLIVDLSSTFLRQGRDLPHRDRNEANEESGLATGWQPVLRALPLCFVDEQGGGNRNVERLDSRCHWDGDPA